MSIMKLIRTCSTSLAIALALLITFQTSVFTAAEKMPADNLTAKVDVASIGKASETTNNKEDQRDCFISVGQFASFATSSNTDFRSLPVVQTPLS